MIRLNKALRKQTLKALMPKIILGAMLTLVLLGISCQGLVLLALGPKELDTVSQEELSGTYVGFDASEVIVAFATWSKSSDSSTRVLETYYLLPYGENQYLAVMDSKEKNADLLDRAMEQSHAYYMEDLETLTPMGRISGTATPLEDGMTEYMVDCIEKYSLPGYEEGGDTAALIYPVQIELNRVGFLSTSVVLLLGGLGLLGLFITLALFLPGWMGAYQKKANALVYENMTGEEVEACFAASQSMEHTHVGAYIWYQKGATTRVLNTGDIIWGYPLPEPLVVSKYRWPVALYNTNQECTRICFMEKKTCQVFLDAIAAQGHPFLDTYSSELAQKFKNDFPAFLQLAQQAAEERNA